MNPWRDLVVDNPMLVEIRRVRSRMLSTRSGGSNLAVIGLLLFFYGCIVLSMLTIAKFIDPIFVIVGQTAVFALLLPVMVAGTIAGERENRTWDILLVAPVTKAQIVAGKFIACLTGLGVFFAFGVIPIFLCLVSYPGAHVGRTLLAEMVSAAFGILLISFSLLVSARTRTTFGALGSCVGVVFVVFGAVPIFINAVLPDSGTRFLGFTYPFGVIGWLASQQGEDLNAHRWQAPLLSIAVYLGLSAGMLIAATATVRKMEEVKNIVPESEGKRGKASA